MTALIRHICDLARPRRPERYARYLARPRRPERYARYLATLGEPALKQKLADLLLDQSKATTEPARFWRVAAVRETRAEESADRRELFTI